MAQEILQKPTKWETTVSERLASASADQIWPLIKDFFGINKYFPNLLTSYGIHGNNGEIGSIRYCEGLIESPQESNVDGKPLAMKWSKEKIIAIHPTQRSLTYEIVDSNTGFNSYVSTVKVVMNPSESGHEDERVGCVLEWSFSVDPVEGFEFEDLVKQYQVWLQVIAQKMENSLAKSGVGN